MYVMTFRHEKEDLPMFAVSGKNRYDYEIVRVQCAEDELIGAKEAAAYEIEERRGGRWICTMILPI